MNFSPRTSGEEGLALLEATRKQHPALPVLLMTAWGSIALAVRGVKAGAADFFTKPWDNARLVELVRTTLALSGARAGAPSPSRRALDAEFDFSGIVGEHPSLLHVLATVGRVAKTRAPVLILGESGTGKELIADAIHRNSPRAGKAAVKVNMFLYLPFEHSEALADQELSMKLYTRLGNEEWTRYARAHHDLIARFGRFPHRNAVLGRESTPGEIEAMAGPMGHF